MSFVGAGGCFFGFLLVLFCCFLLALVEYTPSILSGGRWLYLFVLNIVCFGLPIKINK